MNLDELRAAFSSTGIALVQVGNAAEAVDRGALSVVGDVADFIAAVKVMSMSIVFFDSMTLDDEDFIYDPQGDPEDESAEEAESNGEDLCTIDETLREFKKHVGQVGRFTLLTPPNPQRLTYVVQNDWYTAFWKLRNEAATIVDERLADSQESLDNAEAQRNAALTARLDALIYDKKFCRLPTQKAQIAYAKLNIEGIDNLDNAELKAAISDLRARIDAMGIE